MHRIGYLHGTGAALNVELGWIPDYVKLVNLSDGTKIAEAFLAKIIVFTSGGTTEIKKGDTIRGLTTLGATAKIKEVILDSGSWAGGDAAGWFIVDADDLVGTFTTENVEVNENGTNTASVVAETVLGVDTDTEVAGITGLTPYVGDETNHYAKGFTIASGISTNGKLFGFIAMRSTQGEGRAVKVAGYTQAEAVW